MGVFGFESSSKLAKTIEHQFGIALPQTKAEKQKLQELIIALENSLKKALPETTLSGIRRTPPLLVIVDNSLEFAYEIMDASQAYGLKAAIANDIETLSSNQQDITIALNKKPPTSQPLDEELDVIILNFPLSDADECQLDTLIHQIRQLPPMAAMICTSNDTLKLRVRAARIGACSFLCDLDASQILEIIGAVQSQLHHSSANVLVVDDDPQTLTGVRSLLEPWGFKLTTLEDTPQFWKVLESCAPDLLVLDVEMPHFNGIDLCRVVRHTPPWSEIPVIFLTAHTDVDTEHEAFIAGANDLIGKSSAESELITRLFNQLGWMHIRKTMTAIAVEK
ncbi:MAG TPA: response regulator [Elainellaceae cyanobacterium]